RRLHPRPYMGRAQNRWRLAMENRFLRNYTKMARQRCASGPMASECDSWQKRAEGSEDSPLKVLRNSGVRTRLLPGSMQLAWARQNAKEPSTSDACAPRPADCY